MVMFIAFPTFKTPVLLRVTCKISHFSKVILEPFTTSTGLLVPHQLLSAMAMPCFEPLLDSTVSRDKLFTIEE